MSSPMRTYMHAYMYISEIRIAQIVINVIWKLIELGYLLYLGKVNYISNWVGINILYCIDKIFYVLEN